MALNFPRQNKLIFSSILILALVSLGLYFIYYKSNSCVLDKTLRIVSANEKTRIDVGGQIQEETYKNYILDKDWGLINIYRKACFADNQKSWQFETFSALQYKNKIIGEFSFLTKDSIKLDNLKNSPIYNLSEENKDNQITKLVRYTKNVTFNDHEDIFLLKFTTKSGLNDNSLTGYDWQKVDRLQWLSIDNGETWGYQF